MAGTQAQARKFDELGYRYEFDLFQPADHLTLAANDQFAPAAAFLGTDTVEPRPRARDLRLQPEDGLRRARDGRATPTGSRRRAA